MSMARKLFSFLTVLFAVAMFTTVSVAQETEEKDTTKVETPKRKHGKHRMGAGKGFHGRKGMRGGRRGGMIRGLSRLDLNEAQKSQIRTLHETHKNGQIGLREESRTLRTKMREGTATEEDKTRMRELRAQYRESAEQLKNSVLGILTDDQRQQLKAMGDERRQRMEERRQRMMERKQQREQPKPTDS